MTKRPSLAASVRHADTAPEETVKVTFELEPDLYARLRMFGVQRRVPGHKVLIDALREYLARESTVTEPAPRIQVRRSA